MSDAQEWSGRRLTRAERSSKTRELLAQAALTADPELRRTLLAEIAELNLGVVDAVVASMAGRYTDVDARAMAASAREAYLNAVFSLEPSADLHLLPQVLPAVWDAVQRCARTQLADTGPPGPR